MSRAAEPPRWPHLVALAFAAGAAVVAVTQPWIDTTVSLSGAAAAAVGTDVRAATDLTPWGPLALAGLALAWAITFAAVLVPAASWPRRALAAAGVVATMAALAVLVPAWWLTELVRTAGALQAGESARAGIDAFVFVETIGLLAALAGLTLIGAVAVAILWPTRPTAVAALLGTLATAAVLAWPWMRLYLTTNDGFESRTLWWWQVSGSAAPAVVALSGLTATAWWAAFGRGGGGRVVPVAAFALAVVVFVGAGLVSVDPDEQLADAERTGYVAVDGSVLGASFVYPTALYLLLVALLAWRVRRRSP